MPALDHSANTEGLPRIVLAFLGTLTRRQVGYSPPTCPLELERGPYLCELTQVSK